ncbi:MAG: hypothetical protein AVDCRST_MAG89-1213 [uncultured Gemmatimonadetes bacterium]|uniref:Uncharacterized protein n=1 Tax=uncultured Gemmatimonadota bacterium TaxID=203437 RepID=A0A6J4KQS0_9BACT|nr:MAG: hypothetical protein AVDCRST_MAG89-1213 [uncultured Gemmatimonadota bacterium]
MTHTYETQGRHARDRNVFAHDDRPGPYETSYDVRRGYDEPAPAPARGRKVAETLLFRGRDER